ncbi:hypothetical protein Tco_0849369 [Tanacetum coccineum]
MEEINNFQQEPDENLYQAWERFKELLMKCPQHYLMEMQEVILFYNGLGIPTRQILDSRGAIPSKTVADAKVPIQEMAEYTQKWHNGTSRSRSTKTSDGLAAIRAQLNSLGREIKKVNEKFYAAQVGYEQCKGPHYTKDYPLKEEGKTLEEAYYTQFGGPFQGGGIEQQLRDSIKGTTRILQIQASKDAAIRNQEASIKTLEIQIRQISKVLQERGFRSLPSSIEENPRDQFNSISTTIEADSYPIRHIGSSQYAVSTGQNRTLIYAQGCQSALVDLGASVSVMPLLTYLNLGLGIGKFVFPVDFIILDMPEDIKVTLILGRPFLSTPHAKIDVFKGKITLRVGEERIIFKSIKPANSLIKRVYMLSLRERMELDLEARLMGETLVINISLDPLNGDYIKLNDLNEPFKLRRNQGDNFMPTIKEGGVIEEFRTKDDELDTRIDDYPSCCDYDKKIHIDYAHNLKFSCMIGFEFTPWHTKGNNVIGAIMNVPIFVGTFSVVIDFAVLEDMDAYRDEGMTRCERKEINELVEAFTSLEVLLES